MDTSSDKSADAKQSSLSDRAKAAMRAAGAGAEKTKISTVSLPTAYGALGNDCYKGGRWREEFSTHYEKLGRLRSELEDAKRKSAAEATSEGSLLDKAKQVANKGVEAAKAEKLKLQYRRGLASLGQAAFEKYGKEAGPEELVGKIESLLARLSVLDAEVGEQVTKAGGKKWLLRAGGVVAALLLLVAFMGGPTENTDKPTGSDTAAKDTRESDQETTTDASDEYQQGYNIGVQLSEGFVFGLEKTRTNGEESHLTPEQIKKLQERQLTAWKMKIYEVRKEAEESPDGGWKRHHQGQLEGLMSIAKDYL